MTHKHKHKKNINENKDELENTVYSLMLHTKKKFKSFKKALFTFIIWFAIISFWKWVWDIIWIYLFPFNPTLSAWMSIFIWLGILSVTHYWTQDLF